MQHFLVRWKQCSQYSDKTMGWMVRGSNPSRGNSVSSKHQTSSEAHTASYSMGIRGSYTKALAEGLAAAWCWTLNVSSCDIKNKWSHSSTPPVWPSFHGPDQFIVNCVRSLIPKDSDVFLKFYDFSYFTFLRGHLKLTLKKKEIENLFLELTFCTASFVPRRHHNWSKPCAQLWTNK